jgi:hypothetical protein
MDAHICDKHHGCRSWMRRPRQPSATAESRIGLAYALLTVLRIEMIAMTASASAKIFVIGLDGDARDDECDCRGMIGMSAA